MQSRRNIFIKRAKIVMVTKRFSTRVLTKVHVSEVKLCRGIRRVITTTYVVQKHKFLRTCSIFDKKLLNFINHAAWKCNVLATYIYLVIKTNASLACNIQPKVVITDFSYHENLQTWIDTFCSSYNFFLKSDKFHCFIKIAFMIWLINKINLFEFYDFYLFCE